MCKASVSAKKVIDATVGENYGIGISSHGLGAFHPVGKSVAQCVACVKNGAMVVLANIPHRLRRDYRLEAQEVGTFIDTGDNFHDEIDFGDGRLVPLYEFANRGIQARLSVPATAAKASHIGQDGETTERRELVAA